MSPRHQVHLTQKQEPGVALWASGSNACQYDKECPRAIQGKVMFWSPLQQARKDTS